MVVRRLSWQLGLVMLLVALVPLSGAAFLTLHLLEESTTGQVKVHQEQLALAAAALVRNFIKEGQTRLKLISGRIQESKNPQEQARQLDNQMDPPGMLLEISVVEIKANPEVLAQSQVMEYNKVLSENNPRNRAYSPRFKQQVMNWSNDMPQIVTPAKGSDYAAENLEVVKDIPALPISVPASERRILTANLDFRPMSTILKDIATGSARTIVLHDSIGNLLAQSAQGDAGGLDGELVTKRTVGHGGWTVSVSEPASSVLAHLRAVRRQAYGWFGVAFVMAVGLAALFSRRVVRPIESLSQTANRLSKGEFSVRTGIERSDEFGELARAFDRMASGLEKLDQMKSDFVAHVSHELRTPLTSAKMALANVQEGLAGKESLARVQQDLDRLIRMVNELLDVAKIEAGLPLAKQRTDLGALVRSSVDTLRPLARIPIEVTGNGDAIDLDAGRVQQIIVNLVDNALKYAKSRVDVDVRGREVCVTDDGPGVPLEHRERIFEKFSRVETGPKPPGAGLGLSIARKLAELHGGSLECEGNTFILKL
jgi:signal transduction histidine kinase